MQVSDEVVEEYKFIKKGKKYRYIIFYIKDEKQICIENVSCYIDEFNSYTQSSFIWITLKF